MSDARFPLRLALRARHLPRKRGRKGSGALLLSSPACGGGVREAHGGGRSIALALVVSLLAGGIAAAAQVAPPRLGRAATPDEVAKVDISIPPDGKGLPPGSGSVAQGAQVYAQKCVACHGENGAGTPSGDRLSGGIGSLASGNAVKTVNSYWPYATTVFDYIRRAMPITQPQSLTNDEVYAVTAYILSLDNVVPRDTTLDAQSLPRVQMPNRDGFVNWEPKTLKP